MVRRAAAILLIVMTITTLLAAQPIRLDPQNPRYFQWRGKTIALITSAEHYGAVLNLDFDMDRYLATLERDGLNYTRLFSGSYVEPQGAFGIEHNTLAPAPGRFLAPWAIADQKGDQEDFPKFDLERFSPEYLARLKRFMTLADRRGVVVELTLFCSTYGDQQWARHPLNPQNNIQNLSMPDWKKMNTISNGHGVMAVQEKLVRYLVRELNEFDNLFFEIQNEPWADNHTMGEPINPYMVTHYRWPNAVEVTTAESVGWQRAIARVIADEESRLPHRHLIAQNVANFRLALREDDLVPEASIVNFHYAFPEAVDGNRGLARVIGYDESGFGGREDVTYRRQAWNFLMSGGGLFNNLDYSFCVNAEDGTRVTNDAPGGGSPTLRQQLRVLSQFLHSFDLAGLRPDCTVVLCAPGVVTRTLSAPGQAYAVYAQGRGPTTIQMTLPAGQWTAEWISTDDGRCLKRDVISSNDGAVSLASPEFTEEVALRIVRK